MSRSLLQFLKEARELHLRFVSGALGVVKPPIYVVGNPSADLDSIVSAIVYSYFAHQRTPASAPRSHIPLLNVPSIPSGSELCRLRPEFVKALWLSTNRPATSDEEKWENTPESAGELLAEHIITVDDFATHSRQYGKDNEQLCADVTMVDWNALPVQIERGVGSLTGLGNVHFSVVGYVDHHEYEGFVPSPDAMTSLHQYPAIIQPVGSCASLIVAWLKDSKLWREPEAEAEETHKQLARLALSPILIDTANLTAESKVTDTDRTAVDILLGTLLLDDANVTSVTRATQNEIYNQVLEAKQASLDLLTVDEILDRDFKQWAETTAQGAATLQLGFCSVVKPIQWVIRKAGGPESFLDSLSSFSASRALDIVVVMTAFGSDDKFCRELFVCALRGGLAVEMLESEFIPEASSRLGLRDWYPAEGDGMDQMEAQGIRSALNADAGKDGHWKRLWVQADVSKSRKQVAPLLRSAVTRD
ncbi:exopolyphosphatase [Aspergillus sp. HF37]|nr:exopolyphosphatase [Aspergillus sp. HF37]